MELYRHCRSSSAKISSRLASSLPSSTVSTQALNKASSSARSHIHAASSAKSFIGSRSICFSISSIAFTPHPINTQASPVKLDPLSRYCQFRVISPSRSPTSTRKNLHFSIPVFRFSDFCFPCPPRRLRLPKAHEIQARRETRRGAGDAEEFLRSRCVSAPWVGVASPPPV